MACYHNGRYQPQKKCRGIVYTKNGQIDGQASEHSHLPTDLPPVEKPKSDTKGVGTYQVKEVTHPQGKS